MDCMGKFDIILWDVDGTLLDFGQSERFAMTSCLQSFGLSASELVLKEYSRINDGFWKRLERGEISGEEVLCGRFRVLFEQFSFTGVSPEVFQEVYQNALGSCYFYQEDSFGLCKSLQGKYRQYIVTNGVAMTQKRKLHLSGLDSVVEGVFISGEIGFHKPQEAFFDACFGRIPDFQKERAVIVGDSLTSDILGGLRAGITACWYNPVGLVNDTEIRPDLEIQKLAEIRQYLVLQESF